jgi:hypothetical protein
MDRTKTDATMEQSEREHATEDPERAEIIACARRFKSSWIELASALTRVRRGGQWKRWAYDSFEQYAKNELHLRPETVEKLTGSFSFLQKHAPRVLERDGVTSSIPSYQAVDFLRRAEEADGAPREALGEIHRLVLDEGAPLASVARQYKDVVFPISDADRKERDAATLKAAAARLRDLLPETKAVPKKMANEVAASVERLLLALEQRATHAA